MPAQDDLTQRLRELHEHYIWEVNAAIGEGREDLAWRLADDYLDEAMQTMVEGHDQACERPDCPVCASPRSAAPPAGSASRRSGLWRFLLGDRPARYGRPA